MAGLRYLEQELELQPATGPVDLPEEDYGDQAGLKPLPINRMHRQAGRPINQQAATRERRRGQSTTKPGTAEEVIRRNQRNQETIDNFDPVENDWREWQNRNNPNPRSKPSYPDTQQLDGWFRGAINDALDERRFAFTQDEFQQAKGEKPKEGAELLAQQQQNQKVERGTRLVEFMALNTGRYAALKDALFASLDGKYQSRKEKTGQVHWDDITMDSLPAILQSGDGRQVGNDLLAEWRSLRASQATDRVMNTWDMQTIPTNVTPDGVSFGPDGV